MVLLQSMVSIPSFYPKSFSDTLSGAEHKKQRKLIDPIFTASQISRLTPLFYNVARQVRLPSTHV